MKKQFVGVALVSAFIVLLAFQSEDAVEQAIVQLRQQVADLGLRVSKLEHAAGDGPAYAGQPEGSDGASAAAAQPPVRSIVVDGITQSANHDDNSGEISQLEQQISSLQNVLSQKQQSLAQSTGQAVHGETSDSGWKHTSDRRDINAQVDAKRESLDLYATQLSQKEQQLQQLQGANSQPRQMIHGREGKMVITLVTKFDLSEQLQNVDIGDQITWTGTRQSVDNGSETWLVDSITKVGS